MKAIILAAGQGSRLRPLTDDRPKCMVEYQGKTIIDHILECMHACSITDITIVKGYKAEVLKLPGTKTVLNENYDSTNMLSTLFCAEAEMTDDLIISYADIVYSETVLQALMSSQAPISIVVDKMWRPLWEARMEDPLSDAESMKLDSSGRVVELGKKPNSYDDIEGQYIGLIKISKEILPKVIDFYHSLDRSAVYDGKDFDNMYMTSFLQLIIDHLHPVQGVMVEGGWVEIDCVGDLGVEMVRSS